MTEPSTIVIFGASGDLTKRKLIPSLFHLFQKGHLSPGTIIVGVSRSEMTSEAFAERLFEFACEVLGSICDAESWRVFARMIHYVPADVSEADDLRGLVTRLDELEAARGGSAGRLFYLSIAPRLYEKAIGNLGAVGQADESAGWRRVVIEKPFGRDLETAKALNATVQSVWDESQVFRIDHYLGKETVQNILVFRFANTLFEPVWNRNFIDHVQITVSEEVTVGSRAGYYDSAGVLRDMFQNHLLQLVALVAMEPPGAFEADALRDEKVKVFRSMNPITPDEIESLAVRAQYEGYLAEEKVAPGSTTPTYAALRLDIDNWRWRDVPFFLRSGKAMAAKRTEIVIQFHCPPHMIFDIPKGETLNCNRLTIRIQPDEGIRLHFQTKAPDQGMRLRESDLAFSYRDSFAETPIPEAYERLLLDAINGDAALFTRSDEIELCWSLLDPVLEAWAADDGPPVAQYPVGSWGPEAADGFLLEHGRHWIAPADTPALVP